MKARLAFLLPFCLAAAGLSATTLLAVGLDIEEGPKKIEWVHSTVTDGGAYCWQLSVPRGRDYVGFVAGARRPGSSWFTLDGRGRVVRDKAAETLFASLEAAAAREARPTSMSVKVKQRGDDEAYTFAGWAVDSFGYARAQAAAGPSWAPVDREARSFRQVLPDPSSLEAGQGLLVCVAMLEAGGGSCEGLLIETEDEYFLGEKAFFSKPAYAAMPYAKKAAAFLGTLYADDGIGYRAAVRSTYPDYALSDADLRLFDGDPDLARMQKRFRTHLLNTVLSATGYGDSGLIFLGLDGPAWFECLYGVNRIPYIAIYMRYCFDAGMPVWASSVEEDHPGYVWGDYEPVADGSAIARAARSLVDKASAPAGEEGSLHGLGLLSSVIASAGLGSRVQGLEPTTRPSFQRADLEKIGILLSGFGALEPGDLLVHYGSAEDGDDPPQAAIVVQLPAGPPLAPGRDPVEYLRRLIAVTIRGGDDRVRMGPVLGGDGSGLFADPFSFHARRLVALKGAIK